MIPIGTAVGKYLITGNCGSGSFGTVYSADNLALGDQCAVKLVEVKQGADLQALMAEAQNLRLCESKHIVEAKNADLITHDNKLYLVIEMEYLPQGSLEAAAKNLGLSFQEVLTSSRHVLFALSAAHSRGVIHRDVKPGNILISGPDFKLTDFGISFLKVTANLQKNMNYTVHAAPECRMGLQMADEISDVYSMGMTLYRVAFLRGNLKIDKAKFLAWEAAGRLKSLPDYLGIPAHVPRRLKNVILCATSVDRNDRYASAAAMCRALEKLQLSISWKLGAVPDTWEASANGKQHELNIVPQGASFDVRYMINGRRKAGWKEAYPSYPAAKKFLDGFIAKSALK